MGLIADLKRRWRIVMHIAAEAKSVEEHFPYAALSGIGFNTVWWAAVEHQLDLLIYWHAFTTLGQERPDHPRALVNKLRYLKSMERDVALPESDRAILRELRLEMASVSERRHDFTHSFMEIYDPRADWPFARLRYEGKRLLLESKVYDIEQLAQLTEEIRQLVGLISPLVERLALPWLKANRNLFTNSSAENPHP